MGLAPSTAFRGPPPPTGEEGSCTAELKRRSPLTLPARRVLDHADGRIQIFEDKPGGYSQHVDPSEFQPSVPLGVVQLSVPEPVALPVDLDRQLRGVAIEVEHERADRVLSAKPQAVRLAPELDQSRASGGVILRLKARARLTVALGASTHLA